VRDRQLSRLAVCHDGLVSDRGQISDKTTGDEVRSAEGYEKKKKASDAIDRKRDAPGEEKRGEAW
jgi:hypothetical protein